MSTLTWFDIPMTESHRAREFYAHVLGVPLEVSNFGGSDMILLPKGPNAQAVGGALSRDPHRAPSDQGTLVYLAADLFPGGLDGCVARVPAAGGAVILPRTSIGEHGFIAIFRDSEGNAVGLHTEAP